MQAAEEEATPSPKYVIPRFKKPPPSKELAVVAPSLPVRERWLDHEPSTPVTISFFKGGPIVWAPNGPSMEFWENETKLTKLPWEELPPIEEKRR